MLWITKPVNTHLQRNRWSDSVHAECVRAGEGDGGIYDMCPHILAQELFAEFVLDALNAEMSPVNFSPLET